MIVEIANRCPCCGGLVLVSPMQAGGTRENEHGETVHAFDLALSYQCPACGWLVIQHELNQRSAADFLAATVANREKGHP